jgi:hypothetical protein
VSGQAPAAVADDHVRVVDPGSSQVFPRAACDVGPALHAPHLASEDGQQRRLKPEPGADLEHSLPCNASASIILAISDGCVVT